MEDGDALRLHEADCELERLASLLAVLIDHSEAVHADPLNAAKVAADLARIAHDCLSVTIRRLRRSPLLAAA